MDVVVRQATAADATELGQLRWRWRVEELGERPEVDRESFVQYFARWVIDHMDTHLPFVGDVDGRIGAMAWFVLSDRAPSPRLLDRRGGDIRSLYVVPQLHGTGVGSKLLAALVQYAREIKLVYLTVHAEEKALGFYLRQGFSDDGKWLSYPEERLR